MSFRASNLFLLQSSNIVLTWPGRAGTKKLPVLNPGGKVFYNGLSLVEIAHQIEKTELNIFNRSNASAVKNLKEFRHNHTLERNIVVVQVMEIAWIQVKSMAEFLEPSDAL